MKYLLALTFLISNTVITLILGEPKDFSINEFIQNGLSYLFILIILFILHSFLNILWVVKYILIVTIIFSLILFTTKFLSLPIVIISLYLGSLVLYKIATSTSRVKIVSKELLEKITWLLSVVVVVSILEHMQIVTTFVLFLIGITTLFLLEELDKLFLSLITLGYFLFLSLFYFKEILAPNSLILLLLNNPMIYYFLISKFTEYKVVLERK